VKSNAAGQLLGYSLQFPRALYHLIRIGPGGNVGIEIHGDVSSYEDTGAVVSEEDKSSISGNPLTDRSTDLWKTFYNWINAIADGELDLKLTQFVLYCNQTGKKALVDKFHSASTPQEAAEAIEATKEELGDTDAKHSIWQYYDFVINQNEKIFSELIQQFELQIGTAAAYDDVIFEFKRMSIPDGLIDHVVNTVMGWLQREILERIADRKQAIISWAEYNKKFLILYDRIRQNELIDFASELLPSDEEISGFIRVRPTYIKQLELIKCPDNDLVCAVSDFMRADINRAKWIENETLDEETARDFEGKLQSFWRNCLSDIEITQSGIAEEGRGKLLLSRCHARQESIRGISPPDRTIQGTYHTLADKKNVGWHPRWDELIDQEGGE
jgi:hypothetical protein